MASTTGIAEAEFHALRRKAGWISLLAAIGIMAAKLGAWYLTGSVAILSDGLESIVNVLSATFLVYSLRLAATPPDHNHPYGHGKIEYFSAAFEGALILAASGVILVAAGRALWLGTTLRGFDVGLSVLAIATLANGYLGRFLVRVGRRTESAALIADGKHVLTDVVTSLGVMAGVGLVWVTGWNALDPLVAIAAAAHIAWTGIKVCRGAIAGLMNEADGETLGRIAAALRQDREPAAIEIHALRAWTAGASVHVDFHLVLPCYWSVTDAHKLGRRVARRVERRFPGSCEVIVHLDPCSQDYCRLCRVAPCPIRQAEFEQSPNESWQAWDESTVRPGYPPPRGEL